MHYVYSRLVWRGGGGGYNAAIFFCFYGILPLSKDKEDRQSTYMNSRIVDSGYGIEMKAMGSTDLKEWKDVTKGSLFKNAEVYYIIFDY